MMLLLILIFSLFVYYIANRFWQPIILTSLSLYVYWVLSGSNILWIVGFSLIVAIYSKVLFHKQSLLILCQPIAVFIIGFILLRDYLSGTILPLGYSVLSFTGIGLLVDQYRKPKNYRVWDITSLLLFFPKIFAGPICRADSFIAYESKKLNAINLYLGFKYLIFAAFIKLVMADMVSNVQEYTSGLNALLEMIKFGLNFFFDFWAYSLMAIGLGLIYGYNLPVSFCRPYYSDSFRQFWRRWNITLGGWLKDYIYIPLGGNKLSLFKWAVAISTVFLISGLWHGNTLPFIIWGLTNAFLMIMEHLVTLRFISGKIIKFIYRTIVIITTMLLWQLFIVDSVSEVWWRYVSVFNVVPLNLTTLITCIASIIGMILLTSRPIEAVVFSWPTKKPYIILEVSMLCIMVAILLVFTQDLSFNFFYFRF